MRLLTYLLLLLAPICTRAQIIITYAGNGTIGYSGDGGPATAAQFQELIGIGTDTAGNLYVPDYNNNVIRKVDTSGIITTIAGTGSAGYSGNGGPAIAATFDHPWNVAVDITGNIYVTEQVNHIIRKISTSGIITTIAGNGFAGYSGDGGPATAASFNMPWGIAFDGSNNIYITDGGNHAVRMINATGTVSTLAGNGTAGYNGDNILASTAELSSPSGIIWLSGNLYIADKLNNRIRMISSGIISTFAGTGSPGYTGEGGPATASKINNPTGMTVDEAGNIFFSDFGNNKVRKISGNIISAVAGIGTYGSSGDGGSPLLAQLSQPWGIAMGKNSSLFIADKNNFKVRKVYTPPPSGIKNIPAGKTAMYPNPAHDQLTLTSSEIINGLQILSLTGECVYSETPATKQAKLDITALRPGIYVLRINDSPAGRFIKQ